MIKFYPFVAFVALLLPVSLSAQEKITAQPVSNQSALSLSHVFKKYSLFEINTAAVDQYVKKAASGNIRLELELPGYASFPLDMHRHDILSNDYKLVVGTPQGRQEFPKPGCMTYQGSLTNQDNSNVYLTIDDDFIYGMLNGNSQSWFIEPLQYFDKQAKENVYVIYDTRDVVQHVGIGCGVSEVMTRHISNNSTARVEGSATGTANLVDVAIASDDSMVYRYGTPSKVQQHNIGVMNTMVGYYSNTQLTAGYLEFRIVGQYVSTAVANNALSPLYTGQDATVLLPNFSNWGQAGNFGLTYDLGVYWTTKDITDNAGNTGVIGLAYVGAACTSFRYQILEDLASLDAGQLGSLAAHETGHNFGANHDGSGIMTPSVSTPGATTFSATSIGEINTYMASPSANCFSNANTIMPVAQFNPSSKSVCTGSSITFTDYSVGNVTGVSWTFQGGTPATSTNRSETVTFSTPGLKTITLTATNGNGNNTVTKSVYIGNSIGNGCRTNIAGGSEFGILQSFDLMDVRQGTTSLVAGAYNNFTCTNSTFLNLNTTYSGSANIGFLQLPTWNLFNKLQVFIDYNNDGDFLDANEVIYTSPTSVQGNVNFTFTTPSSVPLMDTYLRLRVVSLENSVATTNGCSIPVTSNVNDYAVYFSNTIALPQLLTGFDGYYSNGKSELNWQTETEVNTDHFIVERSLDGNTYLEVGNVPAKGLTNTRTNYYQLTDPLLNAQNVNRFFYRLKIVDKDGSFKYSKQVITTRPVGDNVPVIVYPNPVLRNTTLQIRKATNDLSVIEIFNAMGQRVYRKQLTASLYNVSVDIPGNWSSGVYMVRITDSKKSWSGAVMIK